MSIVVKQYVPRVEPVTIIEVTEENINEVIEITGEQARRADEIVERPRF